MKSIMVVLLFPLLFAVGISQEKSDETTVGEKTTTTQAQQQYSCPMHPEVTSGKPGKCSKCGMNLVLAQGGKVSPVDQDAAKSPKLTEKIKQAISLLTGLKMELANAGKYNCCIKKPCDRCLIDHQSCSCAHDLKEGKAVCSDCYAGWQRGDGTIEGIDSMNVKGDTHGHGDDH